MPAGPASSSCSTTASAVAEQDRSVRRHDSGHGLLPSKPVLGVDGVLFVGRPAGAETAAPSVPMRLLHRRGRNPNPEFRHRPRVPAVIARTGPAAPQLHPRIVVLLRKPKRPPRSKRSRSAAIPLESATSATRRPGPSGDFGLAAVRPAAASGVSDDRTSSSASRRRFRFARSPLSGASRCGQVFDGFVSLACAFIALDKML